MEIVAGGTVAQAEAYATERRKERCRDLSQAMGIVMRRFVGTGRNACAT